MNFEVHIDSIDYFKIYLFNLNLLKIFNLLFKFQGDFSVDNFVRLHQAAGSGSLETLRDDLGVYLKLLESAMMDLINRDYADFVNLSTNLTGLDRLIEALRTPLGQLREEVLVRIFKQINFFKL